MQNGTIGVTTENIFPIIKKFLYSDHEIFLRELVSNAVDATQKLRTLATAGDFKGELGDLTIHVTADSEARTLTISDAGIGMTAEEVEKYINQIAFSGAEEFMAKYKNQAIIGHFGLGFYSAFMVADKVEIVTQSWHEEAPTVVWCCEGNPSFTMTEHEEKRRRGTDIILHLSEDCAEFADETRIRGMLRKYCRFLPVPIACGKEQEWKDGKYVDTDKDYIVNDTDPLWMHKPADVKEEEYRDFYRKLYPGSDDPLFWIHLNIDYPFHLTGILYFPKIHNNFEIQKNKIQLYCNQVYVTDSVEGIVPEFLTLLHGVIDSPDIPLNVSRSYLQSDSNVRKISGYITRKVADKLNELFTGKREEYESKWDDLKIFIEYGIVTDEKFAEKAENFMLLKNTEGKYFTLEEYRAKIKEQQTDRNGTLVCLYTEDAVGRYSFVEAAHGKGYDVLLMDGQLDIAVVSMLEQKFDKVRFTRVDSDIIDNLIVKEDKKNEVLEAAKQEALSAMFKSQLPKMDKTEFYVVAQAMGEGAAPVMITQSEYMRRMKEMANIQAGMSFYGDMPDMFNLVLNADHPLVKEVLAGEEQACAADIVPIQLSMDDTNNRRNALKKSHEGKKDEEIPTAEKDELSELDKKWNELKTKKEAVLAGYAAQNPVVRQLIDLALLQNGMLKGEALNNFVKRSIELIK